MSNNLMNIETRTRRKAKAVKQTEQENISISPVKTPVENNRVPPKEPEEESQGHHIKKLKTENNSQSKNAISAPRISNKKLIHESLRLLRDCAADNEAFQNNQETINQLSIIIDYKYRSRRVVFTKDLFERKLKSNVTPAIFTKKNNQVRQTKPTTPMEIAFENYLGLVAQLYYKASFQPVNILPVFESNGIFSNTDEQNPLLAIKKPGKRGRKAKPKPQLQQQTDNVEDSTEIVPESSNPVEIENKEEGAKEELKVQAESTTLTKVDIMDSLVSPLKADYVFEKWSPKEIAVFEAGICKYGKEFSFIQFLVKTKNINEIIQFYFAWKNTSHYKMWKHYKNIENKMNFNSWL